MPANHSAWFDNDQGAFPAGPEPGQCDPKGAIERRDVGLRSRQRVRCEPLAQSQLDYRQLYTTKTPITAADLLNDRVLPLFEQHELPMLRMLTDRGTEYCGRAEHHDYELYLAVNDIEHTKIKARTPQTSCGYDWLNQWRCGLFTL